MKLSIIIPVYNSSATINQAVASVLNNRSTDFELIIVDDGCTDNSLSIVKKYCQDNRLKIILSQHKGPSSARNLGLDIASGEYIIFLDADDYLNNHSIDDTLIKYCESIIHPECVIFPYMWANNKKLIEVPFKHRVKTDEVIKYITIHDKLNTVWSKLYKKTIIEKNNIRFDENIVIGEDKVFNLCYFNAISKSQEIIISDRCVWVQRKNVKTSVMSKFSKNTLNDLFKVYNYVYPYACKYNTLQDVNYIYLCKILSYYISCIENKVPLKNNNSSEMVKYFINIKSDSIRFNILRIFIKYNIFIYILYVLKKIISLRKK